MTVAAAIVVAFAAPPALAMSGAQMQQASERDAEMYTLGAVQSLVTFASTDRDVARVNHQHKCLTDGHIGMDSVLRAAINEIDKDPSLLGGPGVVAIAKALRSICGTVQ